MGGPCLWGGGGAWGDGGRSWDGGLGVRAGGLGTTGHRGAATEVVGAGLVPPLRAGLSPSLSPSPSPSPSLP